MTDNQLPTHTADGAPIHWSIPLPAEPGTEAPDLSGWAEVGATDDTGWPPAATPPFQNARGAIITDGPSPPFPATYETRP